MPIRRGEKDQAPQKTIQTSNPSYKSYSRNGYSPIHKKRQREAQQRGFDFQAEVNESLWYIRSVHEPLFNWPIVDTNAWDMMVRQINYFTKGRFKNRFILPKTPGDILVIFRGLPCVIECKCTDKMYVEFVEPDLIKEHQDTFAMDIELEGQGTYLYFICHYPKLLHVMTLQNRLDAGAYQLKNNQSGLSWSEIRPFTTTIIEKSNNIDFRWDIYDILKELIPSRLQEVPKELEVEP